MLIAPFSGIVSPRRAQPGERVALDAEVVSIVDLSRPQLEAPVPPTAIGQVRVGQAMNFHVEGFGTREFAGRIERINPAATVGSRSINVYAVIDNREDLLRGGMFAQGVLTLSEIAGALVVPVIYTYLDDLAAWAKRFGKIAASPGVSTFAPGA